MVQDTNAILEQWRSHYEREIVHLQLAKVENEGANRQKVSEKNDEIVVLEEKANALETQVEDIKKEKETWSKKLESANEEIEALKQTALQVATMKAGYEKSLNQEKMLKLQAVNKLAEILNRKQNTFKDKGKKVSVDALRKKEKECRRLLQELEQEKKKLGSITTKFQQDMDDLHASLAEESARCTELQMMLDSKDADIEVLHNHMQNTATSMDAVSMYSDGDENAHGEPTNTGWLSIPNKTNIKRHGYWKKQYVVVSKRKILFYDSEQDKEVSNPCMVIDLEKLFHVRPVTPAEAMRAKPDEIPLIFQLLYANEGEARRDPEQALPEIADHTKHTAGRISHKGHSFIPIMYHLPTNCEVCPKPLWHMFKSPPAIECQRCRGKFHKEHLDTNLIPPCRVNFDGNAAKELLLKADSSSDQKKWVNQLARKIPKTPPAPLDAIGGNRNSPRVSSGRYNAASRKSSSRGPGDRVQKNQNSDKS